MSLRLVVDAGPLFPLGPGLGPTGVARWTTAALAGLGRVAPDWRIDLVAFALRPRVLPDLSWLPANASFRLIRFPGRPQRWLRTANLMPPIELLVGPADAVLGPAYVTWPARRAAELPVIHDLTHVRHPELVSAGNLRWLRTLLPRVLRRAALVLTVSETMRGEIVEHYRLAPDRVAVVPNGCDAERFAGAGPRPAGLPARYLLFVGTLEPRKNLARLLEAHRRLRETTPGAPPLVIAGGIGWRVEGLVRDLEAHTRSGDVRVLGYVEDALVPALYAHATALLLPSLYEGFGIPVLEAMAAGCPVVTARRGGLPEVGGDAAVYVDPEDPGDIARGVAQLIADDGLRRRLATAGRGRAAEFTLERSGLALRHAIETSLARRAVRGGA